MKLIRVCLSGFMLTVVGAAFADSNIISSSEVFNVSKPSNFSDTQIYQLQTNHEYNPKSREYDTNQRRLVQQENIANVNHSLKENSPSAGSDYFLANNNLGPNGYIRVDSHNISGNDHPVGSADDYDLNDSISIRQIDHDPRYVYYKQSVTVVDPKSPLYVGKVTSVTTGQQVVNRNANQNVLFFCVAGNRAQTAEAFKQVQNADLSVWTDLESFNKCKAWASSP